MGESTLFVRLGECDLRCRWCDSPHTWRPAAECRIETAPGRGTFRSVPNPVSIADALAAAEALDLGGHRWVSLTGGEPLLQPAAAAALARGLGGRGPRILLETHGLATGALPAVAPHVDCVSMDWKLASEVRRASDPRGGPVTDFHAEHTAFLRAARAHAAVWVKLVITVTSTDAELDAAFAAIAGVDPATPVVLQPVTPHGPVRERPSAERMLALLRRATEVLSLVRVIPQTHPIWSAP